MVHRRREDPELELAWEGVSEPGQRGDQPGDEPRQATGRGALGLLVVMVALTVWLLAGQGRGGEGDSEDSTPDTTGSSQELAESLPAPLIAAETYRSAPGPLTARSLLESIGGVEGLIRGSAEGAFDMVTFDPADPAHLLASHRASYGPAENQAVNEEWFVSDGDVAQELFAPDLAHDVAHFNHDGSVAVWANSGNTPAFASRVVTVRSGREEVSFGPVYASRSVIVDNTLFALTGRKDYYSTNRGFLALVADRNGRQTMLDSGERWAWIDSPDIGILVAYPADERGETVVWDTSSLEELPDHPLAGHRYQRVAMSGDRRTAVAITLDGELEAVDTTSGVTVERFGSLNPEGIAQPITLNRDGTIAITIDWNGTVTIWWVGHERPLAIIEGDAGPGRVVPEHRAPRVSSAVEPTGRRIALRRGASSQRPVIWQIIDTDVESWVERACDLAGRVLTTEERQGLGLARTPPACTEVQEAQHDPLVTASWMGREGS